MHKKQILFLLLCIASSLIIITRQHCPQILTQEIKQEENSIVAPVAVALPLPVPLLLPPEPQEELTQDNVMDNVMLSKSEPEETPSLRIVVIKNDITNKMITYTKAFMKYVPDFAVTANDVPIAQGQQAEVLLENNRLIVGYTYNFLNGYRIGSRVIEFTIPQEKDTVNLSFSWQNDWHIIIPGAQPQKVLSQVE